jgi:hypothetical protein
MRQALYYRTFHQRKSKKKKKCLGATLTSERLSCFTWENTESDAITCSTLWSQFELWSSQKQPLDIFSISPVKSLYKRKSCISVHIWLRNNSVTNRSMVCLSSFLWALFLERTNCFNNYNNSNNNNNNNNNNSVPLFKCLPTASDLWQAITESIHNKRQIKAGNVTRTKTRLKLNTK